MENSLVVLGKTLEDAIIKAAGLLHCDPARVAYEVLQQPKPGKFGLPGTPCKLSAKIADVIVEKAPEPKPAPEPEPGLPMPWSESDIDHVPSDWFLQELEDAISQYVSPETDTPENDAASANQAKTRASKEIKGGLHSSQGPIEFDGNLRIIGNIKSGVIVQATGDIYVEGDIEAAYMEAGFNIAITETLRGTAVSKSGSINCHAAWDANIDALSGDVLVRDTSFQSNIHAAKSVTIGELLVGGVCYGENIVEVKVAGSDSGIPTVIYGGHNKHLEDQVEEIRQRALSLTSQLAEYGRIHQSLIPAEERGEQLSTPDRILLWRAATGKAVINDTLAHLSRRKQRLLGMINVYKMSRVSIKDRAYAKVRVIVDDSPIELLNVTQYATFTKDYASGKLRMTSYR